MNPMHATTTARVAVCMCVCVLTIPLLQGHTRHGSSVAAARSHVVEVAPHQKGDLSVRLSGCFRLARVHAYMHIIVVTTSRYATG